LGVPLKSNFLYFFGGNESIWLAHHKKKLKLWTLPKIEDSMERRNVYTLWPSYISEKGRTLGKTYGIKVRCYWEHPWGIEEHIGNPGTWREHVGNKGKMKKILAPPPPNTQNLKEKKSRHFECMLSLPIGCMKFLCSKTVHHHFWPGLIPPL